MNLTFREEFPIVSDRPTGPVPEILKSRYTRARTSSRVVKRFSYTNLALK